MLDDPEAECISECLENLDLFERGMLSLERDPESRSLVDEMFRAIHTIKGSSGFFDFRAVVELSHDGEHLLSAMRDGKLAVESPTIALLLEMADVLRRMLNGGPTTARVPGEPDAAMRGVLQAALQQGLARGGANAPAPAVKPAAAPTIAPVAAVPSTPPVEALPAVPEATGPAAAPVQPQAAPRAPATNDGNDRTLRVDVEVVDRLMDLAGEIVLARNQILRLAASTSDTAYLAAAQRLNVITSELQERVMKTRMQPIGAVWSKFPRLVRDVAKLCDKQVRLEFAGGETELDKSVVEAIKDPLTHLIRNAVDHGVESPQRRVDAGKSAEGVITMRAYAQGGHVVIEVADDGGGIDPDRVLSRALERELVTPDEAARMSTREVLGLIFRPGFSTAQTVSTVSGRGVGMDVVKTNLQKLGGAVEVESRLGGGTTVQLTIPLTLAIVPALIVTCADNRYAIPQSALVELVRVRAGDLQHRIERIHESIVFRLRGDIVPIIDLSVALGVGAPRAADASMNVAVLEVANGRFGVILDEISDSVEIVVKPLAAQLQAISMFAGATVLGDGSIALILDMPDLARRAAVGASEAAPGATSAVVREDANKQMIGSVVVRLTDGSQVAIPMDQVTRLERIPRERMEWGNGHPVVRYRGTLMRCVDLASALGLAGETGTRDFADMLVVEDGVQPVGLVVDRVVEVIDIDAASIMPSLRSGYLGTTVVFERVTDVVDLRVVLESMGVHSQAAWAA